MSAWEVSVEILYVYAFLGGLTGGKFRESCWNFSRIATCASDFYRRREYRREFRSEDHFYPFSSQKKSRFASDFLRRGNRASWGLKKSRHFLGAVKIAAATAENRAILVHSASNSNSRISGTGKGKPAANIGSTLPWALCRPSMRGVFRNRQFQPSRVF